MMPTIAGTTAGTTAEPGWTLEGAASRPMKMMVVVTATFLVALAAHVSFPLPFSPVPLTLQPFAVLLVGLMLGPTMGFATMLLYLGEGAAGMPVFSPLGPGGLAQMLGPTGGYLLSYPLVAGAAGWLASRRAWIPSPLARGAVAATAATAILFACGAGWLGAVLHLSSGAALRWAVLPFLPGEVVKVAAAAVLYGAMQRRAQPPSA